MVFGATRWKMRKGNTVWLVEWQWDGEHARPEWDPIEGILSPRTSERQVMWFVEYAYIHRIFTLAEQLRHLLHPEDSPCRAVRPTWHPYIHCGDNPYVFARKVRNFSVASDGQLRWEDIPLTEPPALLLHRLREPTS